MPRVNATEYQNRRAALKSDWDEGGTLIRRLSAEQQRALHDYYLFAQAVDSAELKTARAEAVQNDPDLTLRARLAYRSFAELRNKDRQKSQPVETMSRLTRVSTRRGNREIVVFSELHSATSAKRLAQILVQAALDQRRRKTPDA